MGNGKSHKYTSVDELIKKALQQRAEKDTDINLEEAWEKFNKKTLIIACFLRLE